MEMEVGYVLFNLEPGTKKSFMEKVRKIRAVNEAHLVIGIFDAVAKIESENIEDLEKVYLNEIESISGVMNSRLHFVACPRTRK
jgi:DNA-binding Lrp family transcriptional regulator